MILIIIKFCELLLRISPRIINSLRSYIKHSKECFLLFPNTSKLVKKHSAAPRFSNLLLGVWKLEETLFLVFDILLQTMFSPLKVEIKSLPLKSLPRRRFRNVILIIIKFCELLLRISPRIINSLRSYIKHSKECFLLFPNTSKLVKKHSAAPRFSNLLLGVWKLEETLFLVFDILLQTMFSPLKVENTR